MALEKYSRPASMGRVGSSKPFMSITDKGPSARLSQAATALVDWSFPVKIDVYVDDKKGQVYVVPSEAGNLRMHKSKDGLATFSAVGLKAVYPEIVGKYDIDVQDEGLLFTKKA